MAAPVGQSPALWQVLEQIGQRRFSVSIEGETVLEDYDCAQNGAGVAQEKTFEGIQVDDGVLDIEFSHGRALATLETRDNNPKVSAIEVEPRPASD